MTSIEKLQIRGIRSFSPNNAQTLDFCKPLTLIVGKNGSGKTTIIECLKMGCTGDLPPNCRNGQAFIHDPKILACQEVKAQIKLKFVAQSGAPVVCTRSFSLTQKATKMEYKAFEAALQTVDAQGAKQSLSYKCADLNRLVPELMGVSPAVLESVIFVHQEDSCWPLSDDATLKKKFDDIFAATQYTKALEEIRKFKNQKKQDEKSLGLELATLEERLGNANKLREEQTASEDTMAQLNQLIQGKQAEVDRCEAKLPGLRQTSQQRMRVRGELSMLNTRLTETRAQHTDKIQNLKNVYEGELDGTDEYLQEMLQTVGAYMQTQEQTLSGKKAEIAEVEGRRESEQQRMYDANSRYEAAKAQRHQHEMAEREAESLLATVSGTYALRLGSSTDTTERAGAAREALRSVCQARQDELSKTKARVQERLKAQMSKEQEQKVKVEGTGAEIERKQAEARELQKRETALTEKLSEMDGNEVRLQRLKDDKRRMQTESETQTQDGGAQADAAELKTTKDKLSGLQHQLSELWDEHSRVDAEHDKQQQFARLKQARDEQHAKLRRAIEEKKPKIDKVLGGSSDVWQLLEDNQLVKRFGEAKRTREAERESQEAEVKNHEQKLGKKETELNAKRHELARQREEQEGAEEEVRKLGGGDPSWLQDGFDFAARATEAEREAEQLQSQNAGEAAMVTEFMTRIIGHGEEKGKCGICGQGFAAPDQQLQFMRKKRQKYEGQAAVSPEEQKERVRQKSELARKLHRAGDEMRRAKKLKTIDRPASEQSLAALQQEAQAIRGELETERHTLEDLKQKERDVQDLRSDVEMLRVWHQEYNKTRYDVESQSGMQSGMYGVPTRTKAQVKEDMDKLQADQEQLQKKVKALEAEMARRANEAAMAQRQLNQVENELVKLQAEVERKEELEAQVKELSDKRARLISEATALRQQEQPMRHELKRLQEDLTTLKAETDREVARDDEKAASVSQDMQRVQMAHDGLRKYTQAGHAFTLQEQQQNFQRAEAAVKESEEKLRTLRASVDQLKAVSSSKESVKLEIQANLEYRQLRDKLQDLEKEIAAKKAEEQALPNAQNADREIAELERTIGKERIEIANANGSLDTVRSRLEGTKKELRDVKYRHIDDEHRKKLIECKTTQLAVKDLDSYYKALDRALMKFHSSKMESINKSIKELWNKTYKGPDIDGLEIHSEHEGETASGARKQSYRVIMTKGDTRLDMRGRCSAGQKVLASLVIRLALAESFCINCGILALDEPTTNLDTANIESFADALNEIIKARKQQSNFQLIVITHDEEFVQRIGRSENCSHYFRVDKRVSDGQSHNAAPHSTIDRFDIGRFG